MEPSTKKTGILGIGNPLLSDEGFGVHVTRYLKEQYLFPDSVTIFEGGTAGIYMSPFLDPHDPVFVVDVLNFREATAGTLYAFTAEEARNGPLQARMSSQQRVLEILDICQLRDTGPAAVEFFCVVPKKLNTGLEMSDPVASQVEKIADLLIRRLEALGHTVHPQPIAREKKRYA